MFTTNVVDTDFLTETQNLLGLERYFSALPKKINRYLSIVFFDLDKFKQVNDNYGHKVGDKLLRDFSHILSNEIRNKDTVARVGGDEFLLVLLTDTLEQINQTLENIRVAIKKYNKANPLKIKYSCGISTNQPNEEINEEELIKAADEKMYKDKNSKK